MKYGGTRDYVLGLEVVLPTGEIIRVGTRTLKNASGYQLERLFTGSEGTLGIITEVTLRIVPKPKKMAMVLAGFDTLEKAGRCVSALIAKPLLPSAMELMDSTCIRAVNKAINAGLPDVAALCMIEVDGDPKVVAEELVEVAKVAESIGAVGLQQTDDPALMSKWTNARKSVMSALSRYGEGMVSVSLADDMAVPISRIPEAVVAFGQIAEKNHVVIGTYGHAADGNLHTKMLLNPESPESWRNGEKAVAEIFDTCVKLGGTVTGEHGGRDIQGPLLPEGARHRGGRHGRYKEGPGPQQHHEPREGPGVGGRLHHTAPPLPLPRPEGLRLRSRTRRLRTI